MDSRRIRQILYALATVLLIAHLIPPGVEQIHWDYQTRYLAAKMVLAGANPYNSQQMSYFAGEKIVYPYVYPPPTLLFSIAFSFVDYPSSSLMYLLFQIACFLGLIFMWHTFFFKEKTDDLFLPFCVLAFNYTVLRDIRAGNVSIFEQLILWSAFYFFIKNRSRLFTYLVVIASSFKLTPMAFVGVGLFSQNKQRIYFTLLGVGLFISYFAASYVLAPKLSADYVDNFIFTLAEKGGERGAVNPSSQALINDVVSFFTVVILGVGWQNLYGLPFYLAYLAFVYFLSKPVFINLLKSNKVGDKLKLVLFSTLVYAIVIPRFKDYSYILLIPAAYYLLTRYAAKIPKNALLALLLIPLPKAFKILVVDTLIPLKDHPLFSPITSSEFFWRLISDASYFLNYQPFLAAVIIWVYYLRVLSKK